MIIGIPGEIKNNENRVGITPGGVETLSADGHKLLIEKGAGTGSGIEDRNYIQAGGDIISDKKALFGEADMIIKVKEPLPEEYGLLEKNQILFTYLHLAADRELTKTLMEKQVTAIAYETVQFADGSLPLLIPMSEVAGRLATHAGIHYLEKPNGGLGVLAGGVPGVRPAKVVVIGGGIVGVNSARMALGLGADVTIMDIDSSRLRYLDEVFQGQIKTLMSSQYNIMEEVSQSDLVIGAVLIPGARAPHLVTEDMIREMKQGSVVVDVAIDQGGCIETTHPTTHDQPVYEKHGVIHYSVANMPGSVPRTSTFALTNVTLPFARKLANQGYRQALISNRALLKGLNIYKGKVTYKAVAEAFGFEYHDPLDLL